VALTSSLGQLLMLMAGHVVDVADDTPDGKPADIGHVVDVVDDIGHVVNDKLVANWATSGLLWTWWTTRQPTSGKLWTW